MKRHKPARRRTAPASLPKAPTGIDGIDEITEGGLPKGRPSLVCGGPGCGKTLLAMEFLVRGATEFNEPGVFMAFEETEADLIQNVASLGFDLAQLALQKKVVVDYVRVERSEIEETGAFDLEGLFIRLGHAIDSIHAKRVVLDTLESLFSSLPNEAILRAELRRLFGWLKTKGVTAVITAERGEARLTRQGLEEYVADCVILLDHRINDQISTRRLRIVKYRGSLHGTNEYPFLIGRRGLMVLPITSMGLQHSAPSQRISSGVPRLDVMLAGKGYYRGSTILVSGTAGTGKSSLAAAFVRAACQRSERALYFAFEESADQIMRNMRSIGIDLAPWARKGLLRFHPARPNLCGLESHLMTMHEEIDRFAPRVVITDPITNLISVGSPLEVAAMLSRMIDFLKARQITTLLTSLTSGGNAVEQSEVGISSLMDTWLLLRNLEHGGERNRALYILKSRGMPHSNQVREFRLSEKGIDLTDVYIGPGIVLTGAARQAQEAREAAENLARRQQIARLRREMERKRRVTLSQIAVLRNTLDAELDELNEGIEQPERQDAAALHDRRAMARQRLADKAAITSAANPADDGPFER